MKLTKNPKFFYTATVILCLIFGSFSNAFGSIYEVGPGKKFERIAEVPFDSIGPGDTIKIYYRQKPYHEKFILRKSGAKNNPITIAGVPSGNKLPIIDGKNAVQFQQELRSEGGGGRWLIKVGDVISGSYIVIKNLHLRNANSLNTFIESDKNYKYKDNAAGVFLRKGRHVLITQCIIQSCGNAILTGYAPDVSHLTVDRCDIKKNGNHQNPSSDQEHNVYLQGALTTVQFCRFGEPFANGNNIKDRSLNTIIRYNWIAGGKNRQLDLVENKGHRKSDAYVYGNVIIQGSRIHNYNMVHWGGEKASRRGALHFFNNTIIGNADRTRFIDTQFADCRVYIKNNVFVGKGKLWNNVGYLSGSNNWFSNTIIVPLRKPLGRKGYNPGFMKQYGIPFFPHAGSYLRNRGTRNIPVSVSYMPNAVSAKRVLKRPSDGFIDIGAYEYFRTSKMNNKGDVHK